jgi:hypothetical protein
VGVESPFQAVSLVTNETIAGCERAASVAARDRVDTTIKTTPTKPSATANPNHTRAVPSIDAQRFTE